MGWNNLDLTWHYVEKWADKKPGAEALVFGDERLTGALLDRLTHRVHVVEMNGESYRLGGHRGKKSSKTDNGDE